MEKNVITSVYTRNGEEISFNFATSLGAVDKMNFVNSVTNLIVGKDYNTVIKDLVFDYIIITTFTDVDVTDINKSNDAISMIEDLLAETNIVDIVKENVDAGLIDELTKAVDDNIEYRTGIHKSPIAESLSHLLDTIEKKIDSIDTKGIMEMAQIISNMSGELTADKMVEAYSKSDIFKEKFAQIRANKEQHKAKIDAIASK